MPFLSIVVPVYGVADYLRKCLDSILAQDFGDFELILVDDGSPDDSPAICDEYAAKDPRVRVLHKTNEGLVRARKSGVGLATGRYVGFVDGDDWVDPHMFGSLCKEAIRSGSDVVGCNFWISHEDREVPAGGALRAGTYSREDLRRDVHPVMISTRRYGEYGVVPAVWCKIFEKSLLEASLQAVPDGLRNGEDGACTYSSLMRANSFILIDDHLYHYRQHPDQMTKDFGWRNLQSMLLLLQVFDSEIVSSSRVMRDQVDYYFQFKLSFLLAAQFDMTHHPHPEPEILRTVCGEPRLRRIASRRSLGALPLEDRLSFRAISIGFRPGIALSYRSVHALKEIRALIFRLLRRASVGSHDSLPKDET